jgi:hypothetical protein
MNTSFILEMSKIEWNNEYGFILTSAITLVFDINGSYFYILIELVVFPVAWK